MKYKNWELMSQQESDTLKEIVKYFLEQEKTIVFDMDVNNSPQNPKHVYDPIFNKTGNLVPWSTAVREYWKARLV